MSDPAELSDLVVECVERIERDGLDALEAVCAEHPEHAEALRGAVQELIDCGVVDVRPARRSSASIGAGQRDFTVVREIGRGGMGVVFEATQPELDRTVALKILHPHLHLDPAAAERFRREAQTAGSLQHPGIAQVYATGVWDGRQFLAMEFIDGAPLDRVLGVLRTHAVGSLGADSIAEAFRAAAGKQLVAPPSAGPGYAGDVARRVAEVADALECAHRSNIVHRDVKPSNVMLRADGRAVLNDFGLARREDLPGMTQSGTFAGTPFYTSPEQAAGRPDVDARADVFSLGATLYELLTLRLPFQAGSSAEVLQAIQHREAPDPRRLNRGLPRDIVAIVQKALEKDRARRYQSAAELAADLRAFADRRPVSAQPIGWVGRTTRWARRQPWQASLAVTLLLGGPTVALLGYRIWADRRTVAIAEREARRVEADQEVLGGYVAIGQRNYSTAGAHFGRALELRPVDPEAWVGAALVAIDGGDAAMRGFLEALERAPEQVSANRGVRRSRANVLLELGRTDAAEREFEALGQPTDWMESFLLGTRSLHDAMRRYDRRGAEAAYRLLLDAAVGAPVARPSVHYSLAVAAGEARNEDGARRVARAMQRLWPDSLATWSGSGLALHHCDPEAAVAAYRRALEISPAMPGLQNNLGNALSALGRSDEAMAAYRAAIAAAPTYSMPRANLGRMLFYRGEIETALEQFRIAVECEPGSVLAQHYLVWSLRRLERFDEAVRAARAGVAATPDMMMLRRDLANALHERGAEGDSAESFEVVREALEIEPADLDTWELLGDLRLETGDLAGGIEAYRERVVRAADPQARTEAREDLAYEILEVQWDSEERAQRIAEALGIAERLVDETERQDPWALELLVCAQRVHRQHAAALATLREAIERARAGQSSEERRLLERLESALPKFEAEARAAEGR